jgi:hypothetical protein
VLGLVDAGHAPAWRLAAALAAPHLARPLCVGSAADEQAPDAQGARDQRQQRQLQQQQEDEEEEAGLSVSAQSESPSDYSSASSGQGEAEAYEGAGGDASHADQQRASPALERPAAPPVARPLATRTPPRKPQVPPSPPPLRAASPGARLRLLAFAARHCEGELLGAVSDELAQAEAELPADSLAAALASTPQRTALLQQALGAVEAPTGGPRSDRGASSGSGGSDQRLTGSAVYAPSAAGAPWHRDLQLRAACASAAGAGTPEMPSLGDAHLLLGALLAGRDSAEAQHQLAAAAGNLQAWPVGAAEEPAAAKGVSARGGQQVGDGSRRAVPCALLQRLLVVGTAAQLLLATAPHARRVIQHAAGSDACSSGSGRGCGAGGASSWAATQQGAQPQAVLLRRLAALQVQQLMAAAESLQAAGSLSEEGRQAAARAARGWQWLQAVAAGARPAIDWGAPEHGAAAPAAGEPHAPWGLGDCAGMCGPRSIGAAFNGLPRRTSS